MLLERELLYFSRPILIFLLLLVALPLKTYFNFLTKPTIIMVSIMLAIIPYCLKIFPSLLIPSPFVHWWDISVKSTQTVLWLKEGSLRRVLRLFWVPVGGWQEYWGLWIGKELCHDESPGVGRDFGSRNHNSDDGCFLSSHFALACFTPSV